MAKPELRRLPNARKRPDLFPGQRAIKMLRPSCLETDREGRPTGGCQSEANLPSDWWRLCLSRGHDPYISVVERTERKPKLSEPDEQGRRQVEGHEEVVWYEEHPNLAEVVVNIRVNSGQGVEKARRKGFVLPEERGLAPFCQYWGCWSQDIKVRSGRFGDYCSDAQARVVAADYMGRHLEVLQPEKREEQLASISL